MNRYLITPLLTSLVVFGVVLQSQTQRSTSTHSHASGNVLGIGSMFTSLSSRSHSESGLLSYEEVEQRILEEWPSVSPAEVFSRRGPSQSLYAHLIRNEANERNEGGTNFLCTLFVHASKRNQKQPQPMSQHQTDGPWFPIHVDRQSGLINVFADDHWQNYATWRDLKVPEYRELTGFGT